jgi:hypothetical protein
MRMEINGNPQNMADMGAGIRKADLAMRILVTRATIRAGSRVNIRDGMRGITTAGIDRKNQVTRNRKA